MKVDWLYYLEEAYIKAEVECNGVLVNELGISQYISGWSLFTGQWTRAKKYASEELLEFWQQNPRKTMTEFEQEWLYSSAAFAYDT